MNYGRKHGCLARLVAALRLLVTALFIADLSISASAQEDNTPVHVGPRANFVSANSGRDVFRSNVDLVLVNVNVLDREGRAVTGLKASDFTLLEDGVRQQVRYFSSEDQALSLVVILDASASMASKLALAKDAVSHIVYATTSNDDFSLILIRDRPIPLFHLDDPVTDLRDRLPQLQPDGFTSLWDGMYLGIKELRNSSNLRRAMIVVSDGGDNRSRFTEHELKSLLREADIDVYAIGLFDRFPGRVEERLGPLQLDELTSATGGRLLSAHASAEVSRAVTEVNNELRNRYLLGYYPRLLTKSGAWHKLKIRMNPQTGSHGSLKVRLYAKKGYFTPPQ